MRKLMNAAKARTDRNLCFGMSQNIKSLHYFVNGFGRKMCAGNSIRSRYSLFNRKIGILSRGHFH